MIPTHRPYLAEEELYAVKKVLDSRWLGMGPVTRQFEQKLQQFLGAKYAIAVNSGTAALHLALLALELRGGDEVIVPSLSFASCAHVVVLCGAVPVFCEVSQDSLTIDLADAQSRITQKTRAIMPVHLGGRTCQMDQILQLAREHNLYVIEDAAQAFGSKYKGFAAGTWGNIGCYSFDPIKNITCAGGGAIVTRDDRIAEKTRLLRYIGINRDSWLRASSDNNWHYQVLTEGYRYHMTDLHAAIGLEQLKRFEIFKARKHAVVQRYDRAFKSLGQLKLLEPVSKQCFPFGYTLRVLNNRRDEMIAFLSQRDIAAKVPAIPNHLQPAFAKYHRWLPVTELLYKEILTLPLYFEMTDDDVEKVISAVRTFFARPAVSPHRFSARRKAAGLRSQTNDSKKLTTGKI